MADIVLAQGSSIPQATQTRYRDMGDGTHALVAAVSGTVATGGLTDNELRAEDVAVVGPLTEAEMRAEPVPVSGTVTATGPQTDAEARATPQPISASPEVGLAANVAEPGAAAAAIVTRIAVAGMVNVLALVAWSLSAVPAAAVNLMVEDGAGTTIFSADVTASGPGFFPFNPPIRGTANTAMVITLANPGGAVLGKVSVHSWVE